MVIHMDNVKQKVIDMDNILDGIGERLRMERERLKQTQTDFAALGGVSKPSQVRYEHGTRHPDGVYLAKIERAGADLVFILTGRRGPAFKDLGKPLEGEFRLEGQDYSRIRIYDVDASAGTGIVPTNEDVSHLLAISNEWVSQLGLVPALTGMIRVRGDSMTPTIPDQSYILVDFRGRADWSRPGIYVVRLGDEIVVKRLKASVEPGNQWAALTSDNPIYEPMFFKNPDQSEFDPIAKVCAVIATT